MDPFDSDILYEGWMVKSPPQKRSSHGYPLIKKKWRRRWFVLEQGKLPGQYLLCYYTDEQKKRQKGTICLDECDQVDIGLKDENGKYDFMFNIRTPKRIYFLAVDSQDQMRTWARMVCEACGLRSTPDEDNASVPLASDVHSRPSTTRPRASTASATTTTSSSKQQQQPAISSPYILISDCYTGTRPAPPAKLPDPSKSSCFHFRSVSTGNADIRTSGRRTSATSSAVAQNSFHVDDDEDDSVFEDSTPPKIQAAPRPPTWGATSSRLSASDDVMVSNLKLGPRSDPPGRPPKPPHLATKVHPSVSGVSPVLTGFENYANSLDIQEAFRLESNNNLSCSSQSSAGPKNLVSQPSVSRDLKPGRKIPGSVTMAASSHSASSSIHPAANFATMGPPVERAHKPRSSAMSTMPRLDHSSFGGSMSMSFAPKTPSFISRDNTSSPDDWLNTDDVASRGNVSDEEQIYFYMPPMNAMSCFGGSSAPLMIPASNFEHPTVAYIDLDLPRSGDSDPVLPVVPADHSSTIYKTIDIEKTDAFNRTKRDRENQRHKNDS